MKLLFLYGPPAAGKLTVAQELAKLTGFRIFHNHLTIELVKEVIPDGNPTQTKLISHLRLEMIEAAAKEGVDLIFTYVYASGHDDSFVDKIVKVIEGNNGEVCFVQLTSSPNILKQRLGNVSRQRYSKIKSPEVLADLLKDYDLYSAVKYSNNISIDSEKATAKKAAKQIVNHFALI